MSIDWMKLYERAVLKRPLATVVLITGVVLAVGYFARDFALDASADSLTLQHDEALSYYRSVRARYGSDDYLIVTFTPREPLFSEPMLAELEAMRDALREVRDVASVISILDVPLIRSPPVELEDLPAGIRRLEEPQTNPELARRELTTSPLYSNYIISEDGRTTALRVDFEQDQIYIELRSRRDGLREKRFAGDLSPGEEEELTRAEIRFDDYRRRQLERERENIAAVRNVLDGYRSVAEIHLGGVPMIVADSIDFIRHDLTVFGIAVLLFLILILGTAFHRLRFVVLPLVTCLATSLIMLGFLGFLDWRVTVVSSNFMSLLLILCLALTLHIIVRYRETHVDSPEAGQRELVLATVRRIVVPCFYTATTTMVAFGSLIVSGIRPVIDFGWMMVIGLAFAFVLAFTLFPAGLLLLRPGQPRPRRDFTGEITAFFARIVENHGRAILVVSGLLCVASVLGMSRLSVENRFIDYYKDSTEIYRGMVLIDQKLGGTTPLDVVINAPTEATRDEQPDEDDPLADLYGEDSAGITAESFWFNRQRLPTVLEIHNYLDSLPETGKVISIATTAEMLQQIEPSILDDNIELSIVHRKLPDDVKAALIDPYLSPDGDQLRFSVRVYESDPSLERGTLLAKIRDELTGHFGLAPQDLHLTGMLVLYNNMLESLFRSQILTLGAVFLAMMAMFVVLFRSLRLAVTAIIPNVASAVIVLGLMGWLGIPLDLMTITIAAITVGIAVDDTIHYVHRFDHEFAKDRDYWAAVRRCHGTIGRAMYYTSVTIMLGFSILALSQFVPTVYFGLLTGFAMIVALLADLTLLPILLVVLRAKG